ncbi:MAG: lysozyme family protein [Streptococcaceae bacterium]|nr:lysozyme family protein [Streptococcaceae bacterium]
MFRKIVLGLMVLVVIVVGLWAYRTHEAVARVESYKPQVQAELAKSGLQGDTQLVLAIIYTETKGGSADIMQSSESLYGKGGANAIASQTESISQGVDELTSLIEYSNSKGCDVYTAVQAYNFGKAYIDYVAVHGKVTSVKLADAYSRTVVAPSLGNKTGATYRHLTWDSLFYNGGKLYVNGGNFFYAGEVHFNFDLLKIFG